MIIRMKFYKTVKPYNGLVSDFWSEGLPVVSFFIFEELRIRRRSLCCTVLVK